MGIFTNRDNKKRYCVFCGKELADGKCTACGREAKEVVELSSLNWQKVPMEVADALGEQKKQLFGNPLYTVKEMIINGDLFIADIHFDAVYEEEFDRSDDDEGKSEYSYYVQFSTPELAPCDRDCETSAGQYDRVEELLKTGSTKEKSCGDEKEIQLLLRICSKEWGCHGDAGKTSVGKLYLLRGEHGKTQAGTQGRCWKYHL